LIIDIILSLDAACGTAAAAQHIANANRHSSHKNHKKINRKTQKELLTAVVWFCGAVPGTVGIRNQNNKGKR